MKITARIRDAEGRKVALDCKPVFGQPYTVYATPWRYESGELRWTLPSGRKCSKKMLDAIDQLDQITIRTGPL